MQPALDPPSATYFRCNAIILCTVAVRLPDQEDELGIGSLQNPIADFQPIVQNFVQNVSRIPFEVPVVVDPEPKLHQITRIVVRHPAFGITRDFGMAAENVTENRGVTSDMADKEDATAGLEDGRFPRQDPSGFEKFSGLHHDQIGRKH